MTERVEPLSHFGRQSSSLVGRERDQALLRDWLSSSLPGHGSLVLVGGEAGIGKTTLVEALAREAAGNGAFVLTGHRYDLTTTPPTGLGLKLQTLIIQARICRHFPTV